MTAASADLQALLALSELDTSISQVVHRLGHLPEAAALDAIDSEIAAVQARRDHVAAALSEVAARQRALEDELAATEARIGTVSARLYSGSVNAARDLQAMTADVEGLRSRASDLEDRVLAVLDERDPLDAAIAAADEELAALAGRRDEAAAARADAAAGADDELADLQGRRRNAAAAVAPQLLADYERLGAHLGGAGAARLVGDRCGGCHLTLSAAELDRVRRAAPDAVLACEECGRILVRTA
jgi:hypothetical protein